MSGIVTGPVWTRSDHQRRSDASRLATFGKRISHGLPLAVAWPSSHGRCGYASQLGLGGAVLRLNGHPLEDAQIEPAQAIDVRRGRQLAFADCSFQPRA